MSPIVCLGLLTLLLIPSYVESVSYVAVVTASGSQGPTETTPTACDGEQDQIPGNYVNNTCTALSGGGSRQLTCYPDGSQTYLEYSDSNNCTTAPYISGNLTAGSINRCMPSYYAGGVLHRISFIFACDVPGSSVTSSPISGDFEGSKYPLSSDTLISEAMYYPTADCSGLPKSTLFNITNNGCMNDPLGPGTAQRLSCHDDPNFYNQFQFIEVWAGQATPGVPSNCPLYNGPTTYFNGNAQGYRRTNFGDCITLWLNEIPYGSYKFTCPSFPIPSSSSSSSSTAAAVSSSSTSSGSSVTSSSTGSSTSIPLTSSSSSSSSTGSGGVDLSTGAGSSGSIKSEVSLLTYLIGIIAIIFIIHY